MAKGRPKGSPTNQLHWKEDEVYNRMDDKPKYLKRANEAKILKLQKKFEKVFDRLEQKELNTHLVNAAEVDRFVSGNF